MNRAARAAFVILATASIALAGAGAIRAATLGATLGPTTVYGSDHEPFVLIVNRSDVAGSVILQADNGWQLAEGAFTLAPGEQHRVPILTVGTGEGRAYMQLAEAGRTAAPGETANAVLLSVRLVVQRPFDPVPLITSLLALLVGLAAALYALWRIKPWQYRLARAER